MAPNRFTADGPAAVRALTSAVAGLAVGIAVGLATRWWFAVTIGWTVGAATYAVWTWISIRRFDASATASHATREDPTRGMTDAILVAASIASLVGVGVLLLGDDGSAHQRNFAAGTGVASVLGAWFVIHTMYVTRYAHLFYSDPEGGIDFGSDRPTYADFAYLAFTIGMTYQVSDTNLQTRALRATALRHAMLSFFLGAVVLATTINLLAGFGS